MTEEPTHIVNLRARLKAAADEPSPYHIEMLNAAVVLAQVAEDLERHDRQRRRDFQQANLPEGYTLLRGTKGYEHGFTAPDGRRFGYWVSRETAREEAWKHRDTPEEFDEPDDLPDSEADALDALAAFLTELASDDNADLGDGPISKVTSCPTRWTAAAALDLLVLAHRRGAFCLEYHAEERAKWEQALTQTLDGIEVHSIIVQLESGNTRCELRAVAPASVLSLPLIGSADTFSLHAAEFAEVQGQLSLDGKAVEGATFRDKLLAAWHQLSERSGCPHDPPHTPGAEDCERP